MRNSKSAYLFTYVLYPLEAGFWVHFEFSLTCLPIFVNNNNEYSYKKFIYKTHFTRICHIKITEIVDNINLV